MSALLEVAVRAARAAGAVITAAREDGGFAVTEKSRSDFVTEVDLAAERAIASIIRAAFPHHGILAEEGGGCGAPNGDVRWVVDPLDGTTNFIRGIPWYAVAVAAEERGVPVEAAVLDVARGELFTATRGGGAFRGSERIAVSAEPDIGRAIALTGIPFRALEHLSAYLPGLERVARSSAGIRRLGSAALDLCLVASGRAEAFWEHGLARWDVSAGSLIVEEAGGRTTDLAGGARQLETGDVLASNGLVHAAMLDCVRPRG